MKNVFTLGIFTLVLTLVGAPTLFATHGWVTYDDETGTRLVAPGFEDDSTEKDVAQGDLNNDGWVDVVVGRKLPGYGPGRSDLLLLNLNGVLTDVTASKAPQWLTENHNTRDLHIADMNGDGWADVVLGLTGFQGVRVYINQGEDGAGNWLGLVDQTPASFLALGRAFCALSVGDVDADGDIDIYLPRYAGNPNDSLQLNNGDATFTDGAANLGASAVNHFSPAAEIADLNGDGFGDVVKISTTNVAQDPPPTPPAELGDHGSFILWNDGHNQFDSIAPQHVPDTEPGVVDNIPNAAYHVTTGDLTGNGLGDIWAVTDSQDFVAYGLYTKADGSVHYLEVQQPTVLSPRTAGEGGNVQIVDVDDDGDPDLAVSPVNNRTFTTCDAANVGEFALVNNVGFGLLVDPFFTSTNIHLHPWDFAFLDVNQDGCTDLFMALCDGGYRVFTRSCND